MLPRAQREARLLANHRAQSQYRLARAVRPMRARNRLATGAALMLLALSACAAVGPPPQIYVLGNAPPARTLNVSQLAEPVVEVKPVPDYLDTTDMLRPGTGGRMLASRSARWGERAIRLACRGAVPCSTAAADGGSDVAVAGESLATGLHRHRPFATQHRMAHAS